MSARDASAMLVRSLAIVVTAMALSPASAPAAGEPEWTITSVSGPTVFAAGSTADQYVITVTNTGAGATTPGQTITIADQLPPGIVATGISGVDLYTAFPYTELTCQTAPLECTYVPSGAVDVGDVLRVTITVEAQGPFLEAKPVNRARVSGGGAGEASTSEPTTIGSTPAAFGVAQFSTAVSTAQAGAHANLTTAFALNQSAANVPADDPKDIELDLPAGLTGDPNPTTVPRCTMTAVVSGTCPPDAAVGAATVVTNNPGTESAEPFVSLVYNIVPYAGEPAAFAFTILNGVAQARLDTSVRTGGDYGVHVSISDVSEQEPILSSSVTLWGVPQRHNGTSGTDQAFPNAHNEPVTFGGRGNGLAVPFLTLPSDCSGEPPAVTLSTDSWQESGAGRPARATLPPITGCDLLSFAPAFGVEPETLRSGAPAGYVVDLRVPQNEDPNGLATPNVRQTQVTLPEGTVISPSAANGLAACSEAQFALHDGRPGGCPPQSTLGTIKIATPLLQLPLEGNVFLGQPECSPCTPADAAAGRMLPLLLEAHGSGVIVKLAGRTAVNQETGQLTTTFSEDPQLPFSDLELSLNGGEDAPLVNPTACQPAIATAKLTPWSTMAPAEISAPPIAIGDCSTTGFSPSLHAGMTDTARAGAFSSFSTTISRPDGQQQLEAISLQTPPGLLGKLSSVSRCAEPQASQGTCSSASQIGTSSETLGAGATPYAVGDGKVYLTGPYGGAPFGLSIVVPAVAGPFNLGRVVVRASISVDPRTSALTISSGALPSVIDGVPLRLRTVNVDINRPGFMFNPTNCDPLSIGATISSTAGAAAAVSTPFQAVNCATLPFHPTFTVLTQARTSKANGAGLHVKVTSGAGQANIGKVKVDLPKQLPSRLTTLQKACPDATFNANPAACPAASVVGSATAVTSVLNAPLTGPAYLVSHAGAAFPDLVIVLQGEGITLDLIGKTDIKKGITISAFNAVPDAPISSFDLVLPEGPHSALAAYGSLCKSKLNMPTAITGQNGAVIKQTSKVAVAGCPRHKKARKPNTHRHGRRARR